MTKEEALEVVLLGEPPRFVPCPDCSGSTDLDDDGFLRPCGTCKNRGDIDNAEAVGAYLQAKETLSAQPTDEEALELVLKGRPEMWVSCTTCAGDGCPACDQHGQIQNPYGVAEYEKALRKMSVKDPEHKRLDAEIRRLDERVGRMSCSVSNLKKP